MSSNKNNPYFHEEVSKDSNEKSFQSSNTPITNTNREIEPIKEVVKDENQLKTGLPCIDQMNKHSLNEKQKQHSSLLEEDSYPYGASSSFSPHFGLYNTLPGPTFQGIPGGSFPQIGNSDLNPFSGSNSGGMLFDPFQNKNRFNIPRGPEGSRFPGARFDPIGPPGVFPQGIRPPNPDHSKMPDPDWNDYI